MGTAIGYGMIVAALSPVELWGAARDSGGFHHEILMLWSIWVPIVIGVGLMLAAIGIYRRRAAGKAMLKSFHRTADRLDLTPNERIVLEQIARLANVTRFSSIFTMETAFERGVSLLSESRAVEEMPEEVARHTTEVIESLRVKLGMEFSPYDDGDPEEAVHLTKGDGVTFVHRGSATAVEATVTSTNGRDVTLQFADEVSLRVGQACVIHRVCDDQQWEYDISITEPGEGFAVARLIGKPRKRNLRRFVRVPTRRTAYAAAFPFSSLEVSDDTAQSDDTPQSDDTAQSDDTPQFVAGTLTEIGGPGLRLDVPLSVEAGDRVLVVLKMDEGKTIQGTAVVRRVLDSHDAAHVVAVEMVGLSEAEIGELQRETNAAARQDTEAAPRQVVTTTGAG